MKRMTLFATVLVFFVLSFSSDCLAGGYDFDLKVKHQAVLAFAPEPKSTDVKSGPIKGSGFLMDDIGHLVTSYRVLRENSPQFSFKAYGGGRYSIKKVVARDETLDLAKVLLDVSRERPPRLEISEPLPGLGERLLVLGTRDDRDGVVAEGLVSAIHFMPDGKKMIEITAPVAQGCCGGPVINMNGQVIGVSSPKVIGGRTIHLAIPIRYARELGNRNNFPWQWAKRSAGDMKSLSNVVPVEWTE
ncbi:MAG: serine protease [Desulfobacteraceae bacterium]|nr:MAG: serine protease [Desulfobacteraceae bacterium]